MGLTFKDLLNNTKLGKIDDKRVGVQYTEIAKDGVYYTYDNGAMAITQKQHTIPEGVITGNVLGTVEAGFQLHKKVPFSFFLKIIQFYYDVNKKYSTEVSAIIYRNVDGAVLPDDLREDYGQAYYEEGEFVLVVPQQTNSGARSEFANINKELSDPLFEWCEANLVGVCESHSHNVMADFWSGTDDKYEQHNKLRMFMVVGHLGAHQKPTFRVRYCFNQKYTDLLPLDTLFDVPVFTRGIHAVDNGLSSIFKQEAVEVPILEVLHQIDLSNGVIEYPQDDWMSKLKQPTYSSNNNKYDTSNTNMGKVYTQTTLIEEPEDDLDAYNKGVSFCKDQLKTIDLRNIMDILDLSAKTDLDNVGNNISTMDFSSLWDEMGLYDEDYISNECLNIDEYQAGFQGEFYNHLEQLLDGRSYGDLEMLEQFNYTLSELLTQVDDILNAPDESDEIDEDLVDEFEEELQGTDEGWVDDINGTVLVAGTGQTTPTVRSGFFSRFK